MLRNFRNPNFLVFVAAVVLVLLAILAMLTVYQVESGTRRLVFTGGSITDVADEGFHLKAPFIQRTVEVDITTQSTTVENLSAASKDLQNVTSQINVNWRFDNSKLVEIYEATRLQVDTKIIQPRVKETLKAVTAKYTAEELIQRRQEVKSEIDAKLKEDLGKYHLITEDIQLTSFNFSKAFDDAIEAKQTEVQNALKAKNILERTKIEAEERIIRAKAEAEAIEIQARAIQSQGGQEYVQLKWIEKWSGNTPLYISDGNNLISLPNSK